MSSISQKAFLVEHLRGTGREITVRQARAQYGIQNLRARISELRGLGLNVLSRKNYRGAAAYRMTVRDQFGSRAAVAV